METVVVRGGLKRVALAVLFLEFFAVSSSFAARSVQLAWDASPDPNVVGYNAYYGAASGTYTNIAPVGNVTNVVIPGLRDGVTYYFAVTAVDSVGTESEFSNEVNYSVPSATQPPSISAIANQSVAANSATPAIPFVIGDPDTAASSLTLAATSSVPSLVPTANIIFGGSGSNRTVQLTPAANQYGTATISVIVSDDTGNSALSSFVLTVNPPPTKPPTISTIANQTIAANTSTATLPFTIGDPDTPATSLTLTASSSLTSLVPVSNIVFGGSGSNRTVTVTPAANQYGAVTIGITVRDTTNTASTSFVLIVTNPPPTQPPTITTIANQSIAANTATAALPFTIGDPDTQAASLTLTASSSLTSLVPVSNIVFGGSGSNRTVTVTPAANQYGTVTIGITVRDTTNTASTSFVLTVTNPPPTQPPTITTIANQTISENTSTLALPFTIGDPDTPATSLTLTASSSLTSLVPVSSIVFGGSGSNRTVTVTPAANQYGAVTIGITVRDTTNTASTSFVLTVNSNMPPTQAPTITAIANQAITENNSTGPLPFTIGDPDTPATSLTLTASSSLTSLVPVSSIVFGGSGSNRTVTVTPAANQYGAVTIGITVRDTTNTASTSFVLTVNSNTPPTQPPTITTIANQTIAENTSTAALPFTIGDPDTPVGSLTLTASSSLTSLVPVSNIVFGGSGSNRTVTVTPAANQFGMVTIAVTVRDTTNTASTLFVLTVTNTPPTQPPTITTIANQTINENSSTAALPFTIGDPDTPANSLTLTASSSQTSVVPLSNIVFGGSGSNRTVTVTPAADKYGIVTIGITVRDTTNSASTSFVLTVKSNPPPALPPTITAISNQTIMVNTATEALPFVIGDPDTPVSNLTLTASSSLPSLIPLSGIAFGGSDSNRTVTVTPSRDAFGSALIGVYVTDPTGKSNFTTFTLTVESNPPPTGFVLAASGEGHVTPDLGRQRRVVGRRYAITAVPARGHVFAGWTGSITSSAPRLNFRMESNIVLVANFIPNPFIPFTGNYNGLFFEDGGVKLESAGFFNLRIMGNGAYSGRLRLAGRQAPFSGRMNLDCQASNHIKFGSDFLTLQFHVDTNDPTGRITGQIDGPGWMSSIQALRSVYNAKSNPAPIAGNYTVILPAPDVPTGHGFGVLRVNANGVAVFSGSLGDGTRLTQGVTISEDNQWPLFSPLYGGSGLIIGTPQFTNTADYDLEGSMVWIKPANPRSRFYPDGFTSEYTMFGSRYTPPVGTNTILQLNAADMQFIGGNLPADFVNVITLEPRDHVLNLSTNKLNMTFNRGNGTFNGLVTDPTEGKRYRFKGAVLQKMNVGYGFFIGTNATGIVAFGQ